MNERFVLPATALVDRVNRSFERVAVLSGGLRDEQLEVPKLAIVNPFVWELGHAAFFYEAFVLRELGYTESLIAGGDDLYDSFTVDHDDRWDLPLPTHAETLDYRSRVRDAVIAALESREVGPRETYLIVLATLHEGMHAEAFTYMRQTLGYSAPELAPAHVDLDAGPYAGDAAVPGGDYRLGADPDADFVFDNEKWAHPVALEPFSISKAPVTNREYLEFVDDGGYRRRELWSRQGWAWRVRDEVEAPAHWRRGDGGWACERFDQRRELRPHAPVVHVSWYEAEAYCRWADRRLPTEAEWELAAGGESKRRYPWGDEPPTPVRANLDWSRLDPVDVAALPDGDSPFGCRQMLGNVWEWTASAFYPFPGYIVDTPYREYSAPWFGDRKVLRGGAWATPAELPTITYRNFFPPDRTDVFAGFRTCAR